MYVDVNGARLFFDTVGPALAVGEDRMTPRPALVVLHGGPGFDHALMRPWFDRFADAFQVIYLDHRGNGRSGGDPDTWTLAQWGDDVKGFCDALGVERPYVYGLSFGGMVAMSYAARHPGHAARLVFASTAARMDLPTTYAMMERLGGPKAREVAERFWTAPTPEGAAEYMAVCFPLYNPGPNADWAASRRAILRTEVMFHFIEGEQRRLDLLGDLARVTSPTLVLAGGLDPITPRACSEAIHAALLSGLSRIEVFEDAGHGVHRDEPERAEASLRAFLQA